MGNRQHINKALEKIKYLLHRGEFVVIFPEGKRSITGRVDTQDFQYGVGDIVREVPDCHVLCIYLRADKQQARSDAPPYNSQIDISFKMIEPKTAFIGLRASRDIANQIINQLVAQETEYFRHGS